LEASSQAKTINNSVGGILASGMAGFVFALLSGNLKVQQTIENGSISDKFGLPLAWTETLTREVCGGFDCVGSVRPIIHWPLLVLDVLFFAGISYLAFLFYRRLSTR